MRLALLGYRGKVGRVLLPALKGAGHQVTPWDFMLLRHCYVAETDEQAQEEMEEAFTAFVLMFKNHAVPPDISQLPDAYAYNREMFTQLLSQPPIPLNSARRGWSVDPAIEAVVMRGLARDPADRYPDVLAFAQALRTALMSPPPRRDGFLARMKSLLQRNEQS